MAQSRDPDRLLRLLQHRAFTLQTFDINQQYCANAFRAGSPILAFGKFPSLLLDAQGEDDCDWIAKFITFFQDLHLDTKNESIALKKSDGAWLKSTQKQFIELVLDNILVWRQGVRSYHMREDVLNLLLGVNHIIVSLHSIVLACVYHMNESWWDALKNVQEDAAYIEQKLSLIKALIEDEKNGLEQWIVEAILHNHFSYLSKMPRQTALELLQADQLKALQTIEKGIEGTVTDIEYVQNGLTSISIEDISRMFDTYPSMLDPALITDFTKIEMSILSKLKQYEHLCNSDDDLCKLVIQNVPELPIVLYELNLLVIQISIFDLLNPDGTITEAFHEAIGRPDPTVLALPVERLLLAFAAYVPQIMAKEGAGDYKALLDTDEATKLYHVMAHIRKNNLSVWIKECLAYYAEHFQDRASHEQHAKDQVSSFTFGNALKWGTTFVALGLGLFAASRRNVVELLPSSSTMSTALSTTASSLSSTVSSVASSASSSVSSMLSSSMNKSSSS